MWGGRDAFTPLSEQDALSAAIAGSELVIYTHAGHAVHWEEPVGFAMDVASFVRRFAGEVLEDPALHP